MQITAFIKKSNNVIADSLKTIQSLNHKDIILFDIIFIDKLSDIDYGIIKSDWWIVLYDDEMIEFRLLEAMILGSNCDRYDVFSFYKRSNKVTICPRMFRKHVRLEAEYLYPVLPVRIEALLDGWVLEHCNDSDAGECETTEDVVRVC